MNDKGPASIRDNVFIDFIAKEPALNFPEHGLSLYTQDDRLIASTISFQESQKVSVIVATDDTGLKIKLKGHQIQYFSLPDELRLPQELTQDEVELISLRRKIADLTSRAPDLKVAFENKLNSAVIGSQELYYTQVKSEELLENIKEDHPIFSIHSLDLYSKKLSHSQLTTLQIGPGYVDSYNRSLWKYYDKYREYLTECTRIEQLRMQFVAITINTINSGTSPASDIDISIIFPDYIILGNVNNLPSFPDPPSPPKVPDILSSSAIDSALTRDFPAFHQNLVPIEQSVKGPSFSEGHTVHYWIKNLRHGKSLTLNPFLVSFMAGVEKINFVCEYSAACNELPAALSGKLHFKV